MKCPIADLLWQIQGAAANQGCVRPWAGRRQEQDKGGNTMMRSTGILRIVRFLMTLLVISTVLATAPGLPFL